MVVSGDAWELRPSWAAVTDRPDGPGTQVCCPCPKGLLCPPLGGGSRRLKRSGTVWALFAFNVNLRRSGCFCKLGLVGDLEFCWQCRRPEKARGCHAADRSACSSGGAGALSLGAEPSPGAGGCGGPIREPARVSLAAMVLDTPGAESEGVGPFPAPWRGRCSRPSSSRGVDAGAGEPAGHHVHAMCPVPGPEAQCEWAGEVPAAWTCAGGQGQVVGVWDTPACPLTCPAFLRYRSHVVWG